MGVNHQAVNDNLQKTTTKAPHYIKVPQEQCDSQGYSAAMHSTSILASNGNAATWYVERAGAGEGKSAQQKVMWKRGNYTVATTCNFQDMSVKTKQNNSHLA